VPEFIVRAHAAATDPARFLGQVGTAGHVEYLARIIVNALFIAKGHRADTTLTLVVENSTDYSRALTLRGESLGNLNGLTEPELLETLANSLFEARALAKEAEIVTEHGIRVSATSFEHLAKQRLAACEVLLLDRKGEDLRDCELRGDAVFLLGDHVPMPRKLQKSLVRQGARPLSVGPVMLHTAQCIVVIQNEFDRRGL